MHILKFIRNVLVAALLTLNATVSSAGALAVGEYVPSDRTMASPIIITGYSFRADRIDYVQLYNSSRDVVRVDGWTLAYAVSGQPVVLFVTLSGMIRPDDYVLAATPEVSSDAEFVYGQTGTGGSTASSIQLMPQAPYMPHAVTLKSDVVTTHWHRNISTATGDYLSTFSAFTPDSTSILYVGGLYELPIEPLLQITEILSNPRNCSPIEEDLACSDYVKIYNASMSDIDLSSYRLRIGYQGQAVSSSNAFELTGTLTAGHYATITKSADDSRLSATNSGAYVWLEDIYGMTRYDSTIVEYPDASSDSKKGQVWAYDNSDGIWKWSTAPTPGDALSRFPPTVAAPSASVRTLTPCKEGQYRSEETNRCRSIVSTVAAAFALCDAGEERNPETNRCRKIVTASAELAPCKDGYERNPDTNRCRKIVAAATMPTAGYGVDHVGSAQGDITGWIVAAGVFALGLGYVVWEWRRELGRAMTYVLRRTSGVVGLVRRS